MRRSGRKTYDGCVVVHLAQEIPERDVLPGRFSGLGERFVQGWVLGVGRRGVYGHVDVGVELGVVGDGGLLGGGGIGGGGGVGVGIGGGHGGKG